MNIVVCTSSSTVVATLCEYLQQQMPGEVGYVYGKGNTARGKRVVVTTLRSLPTIPPEEVQQLLCDECHDVGDNVAGKDIAKFCFARRFGFSASPVRNDGSGIVMEALFGPTILKMTYEESVDAGMVTPMKYVMLPCAKGPNVCHRADDPSANLSDVFLKRFSYWDNAYRNAVIKHFVSIQAYRLAGTLAA